MCSQHGLYLHSHMYWHGNGHYSTLVNGKILRFSPFSVKNSSEFLTELFYSIIHIFQLFTHLDDPMKWKVNLRNFNSNQYVALIFPQTQISSGKLQIAPLWFSVFSIWYPVVWKHFTLLSCGFMFTSPSRLDVKYGTRSAKISKPQGIKVIYFMNHMGSKVKKWC